MKVLVGAFDQEMALVGAFSVIVKTGCGTDGGLHSTSEDWWWGVIWSWWWRYIMVTHYIMTRVIWLHYRAPTSYILHHIFCLDAESLEGFTKSKRSLTLSLPMTWPSCLTSYREGATGQMDVTRRCHHHETRDTWHVTRDTSDHSPQCPHVS